MDVSFDDLIQRLDDEIQLLTSDSRYGVRLWVCREIYDEAINRARQAGRFDIANLLGTPSPDWSCYGVATEEGLPVFNELRYKLEQALNQWEGPLSPKEWRRTIWGHVREDVDSHEGEWRIPSRPGSTERRVSIHPDDVRRLEKK